MLNNPSQYSWPELWKTVGENINKVACVWVWVCVCGGVLCLECTASGLCRDRRIGRMNFMLISTRVRTEIHNESPESLKMIMYFCYQKFLIDVRWRTFMIVLESSVR